MRHLFFILLLVAPAIVFAQEPRPKVVTEVPADLFNYFAWAAGVVIAALVAAIVVLYRSKSAGLSIEQATSLKKVHDDLLPLVEKLESEQEGRREDIERLMGEQKDVFVKGLELTGKLPPLMNDLRGLLERVERLLRNMEPPNGRVR